MSKLRDKIQIQDQDSEEVEMFDTNYCTYENTVIKAPMSKDSNEYNEFISMYNKMTMNGYL